MTATDRRWWAELRAHVLAHPEAFPLATALPPRRLVAVIHNETDRLKRTAFLLSAEYGNPDLGNKADPVDELVYIILSRRTREGAYQEAYDAIRREWSSWDAVADAPLDEIAATVRASGLGYRKASSIKGALQGVRRQFGTSTLDVDDWDDHRVFAFLTSLPEVGPKSAYCVMAMSLGRATFAVDAHVGRVMARIGLYRQLGLDLGPLDHKKRQELIPPMVPIVLRRDFHVNLVAHGRARCTVSRPSCRGCPIVADCAYGLEVAQG